MLHLLSWCVPTALAVTVVILVYVQLKLANQYWDRRGVHSAKGEPFFGSTRGLFLIKESSADVFQKVYDELEGYSFGGFYRMTTPCVMLRDPRLVRRILIKDFNHFHDRGINAQNDPLSRHLFLLEGDLWRELRTQLSSAFSPGKTRRMFFLVEECCKRMLRCFEETCGGAPYRDIDFKEGFSRFTTDVIGACAFGIECGAIDDANSQFQQIGRKIFETSYRDAFRKFLFMYMEGAAKLLRVGIFQSDIQEFFFRIFQETLEYRKKNNLQRDDLMHLLMKLKEKGLAAVTEGNSGDHTEYSNDLLISNAFLVFVVGFEMTSSTMTFCLYELAMQPVLQNKVRREVDNVLRKYGGQLTIEGLQEMTYLDQVVCETLRLYPPMNFLQRGCTEPYVMPGGSVVLERGTTVVVPVFSIQRDQRHFPEPLEFRPERFADDHGRAATHPAYMPFGEGPRTCMGQVFALAEVKAGVAAVLSRYEFSQSPRTPSRPVRIEPRKFFTNPADGMWLRVSPRKWLPAD